MRINTIQANFKIAAFLFFTSIVISGCVLVEIIRWAETDANKPIRACQVFGHWKRGDKKVDFWLYPDSTVLSSFENAKGQREYVKGTWDFDSSGVFCSFSRLLKDYKGSHPGGLFFGKSLFRGDPDTAPGETPNYYVQQTPFTGNLESLDKSRQKKTYITYSFIDRQGKIVAPGPFLSTSMFKNGIARVTWLVPKELEKYIEGQCKEVEAFIDLEGKFHSLLFEKSYRTKAGYIHVQSARFFTRPNSLQVLFPYTYQNEKSQSIELLHSKYLFKEPVAIKRERENSKDPEFLYGFLGNQSEFLISPKYRYASSFCEGTAAVSDGRKYYFIDTFGERIFERTFNYASDFSQGLAAVVENESWGYVGKKGQYVISPNFEWCGRFKDGIAPVRYDGRYGFIDMSGKFIVEPTYLGALSCGQGLLPVVNSTGNWGYISKSGKTVIPFKYQYARPFSEGRAAVAIARDEETKLNPIIRASQLLLLARETTSACDARHLLEKAVELGGKSKIAAQAKKLIKIKGLEGINPGTLKVYDKASKLLRDKNFPLALDTFEKLIDKSPNFAKAHYGKAMILYKQNKYKESELAMLAILRKNKDYARGYWILASSLYKQGRNSAAFDLCKAGLDIDPLDKHLWKLLFSINQGP